MLYTAPFPPLLFFKAPPAQLCDLISFELEEYSVPGGWSRLSPTRASLSDLSGASCLSLRFPAIREDRCKSSRRRHGSLSPIGFWDTSNQVNCQISFHPPLGITLYRFEDIGFSSLLSPLFPALRFFLFLLLVFASLCQTQPTRPVGARFFFLVQGRKANITSCTHSFYFVCQPCYVCRLFPDQFLPKRWFLCSY